MNIIYYKVEHVDLYAPNRARAKVVGKGSDSLPSEAKVVGKGHLSDGCGYLIYEGIADFFTDEPMEPRHAVFYTT